MHIRAIFPALLLPLLVLIGEAAAEPPPTGADTALQVTVGKALLEEGRRLVREDHLKEALEKLEASVRNHPSPEALLALGDCQEKLGATATAWGTFQRAEEKAGAPGQAATAREAGRRAAAIEPWLSRVRVVVAASEAEPEVTIDDRWGLAKSTWGVPLPLDPGAHRVSATRAGRRSFSTTFELAAGASWEVVVPELEALPRPSLSRLEPGGVLPVSQYRSSSGSSTLRYRARIDYRALHTAGWVMFGVGATAGVTGFLMASSSGHVKGSTGDLLLTTGLGMTFGGGAVAGAGVIMLLQAEKHVGSLSPRFDVGPLVARDGGGLAFHGAF